MPLPLSEEERTVLEEKDTDAAGTGKYTTFYPNDGHADRGDAPPLPPTEWQVPEAVLDKPRLVKASPI